MLVPTKGFRCELTPPAMEKLDRLLEEILRTLWGLNGTTQNAASLEDAASDGSIYGRQDGAWAQITPAGIGASADNHSHTPAEIGASASDHTHTPAEIGASASNHTHTPAEIGASADNHTHDTSDFAKLSSTHNHYTYSQTVTPATIASMSGEVNWNLDEAQNAELTVVETITDWTVSGGADGRFLSLRLSATGSDFITWPSDVFKNMDTFTMPESGQVSILSFRCRTAGVLEFCGQSPAFDEWGD